MDILAFKAIHFVGLVAWFAGLFYLPRLFVYHAEALENSADEALARQYEHMEKRLYRIIMIPAMLITLIAGTGMLILEPGYLQYGWMHVKLTLVLLLIGYHHICRSYMRKLARHENPMSSMRFRLFNEIPTILLVAIVPLAVFKDALELTTLILILVGLLSILILSTLVYKRVREKAKENK
ncbi:MAG: protoporphyrinogen oxidase HemJ [Saprospiraceae bacterium]|nr:protoporphyrinogen oxidase HemJ [Saprospiraceae bacterium]